MLKKTRAPSAPGKPPSLAPEWFSVLRAARILSLQKGLGGLFTAQVLSAELGIEKRTASGWLSKFVTWRYAKRVGYDKSGRGRPRTQYMLTDYGMSREAPELRRGLDGSCPTCGQPLKGAR